MTIYNNPSTTFDTSTIIAIVALISSWVALFLQVYFPFFRKTQKLTLNIIFPFDATEGLNREIAKNNISLSNSGNTSILLVGINYQTNNYNPTLNAETSSTYETNIYPNTLPILMKPGETILYKIVSNRDLFLDAIKDLKANKNNGFEFDVYLKFTVVVNDKSNNYSVIIHRTCYYNPEKVHHHYSKILTGIDVLNKKYLRRF